MNEILDIITIIEGLRTLSGNAQIDYLTQFKDNTVLKEILQYTYNPDFVYHIAEAKLDKYKGLFLSTMNQELIYDKSYWYSFKDELNRLASVKGVKDDEVRNVCEKYLSNKFEPLNELFRGILLKDLRINMGVKTFNKVWDDFYFRYPYMGCKSFSDKNLDKIVYPAFVQTKMDGLFCNAIVDPVNKTVEYISRQGKPVKIQHALDEALLNITYTDKKFVLNGEILVFNGDKPYPRKITNGIINADTKTLEQLSNIKMVCWDIIPYDNFVKGEWNTPYDCRFSILQRMVSQTEGRLLLVDTQIADDKEEAYKLFNEKYSQGEEGVVVKERNGIWKDGKPKNQVKIKAEKDCDLQMVEFIEGKGAYAGMCGSIRCISSDKKLEVYIKPRTPEDAIYIWSNQEANLGKIVAVKYNEKIKSDGKDTYSLYLPVFIEIRTDKDIADTFESIQ